MSKENLNFLLLVRKSVNVFYNLMVNKCDAQAQQKLEVQSLDPLVVGYF